MRNEELWYRLSAIIFFVEATAGRLFLVCPYIPAISTHYLCFHKPCRGRYFAVPQNRCRSLRIYVALRDRKAVQVYASMLVLFDVWVLCTFWICSAPLSRLTPIEALPQASLRALP